MDRKPDDPPINLGAAANGNHRWVLIATILGSSMVFIDGSALNVALPAIQADLGASASDLLWIFNAYLLMLGSLILIGGSLGDRLGRKKVFMAGIVLFMLSSLACGLAPSSGFLIGFRVIQGIAGALMIPGSLAIIAAGFVSGIRGRAFGTWAATTTIVTVSGPVIGGALADAGLWRGIFFINLPIGLAALMILGYRVPESRDTDPSRRLDLSGAALVAAGLGALTFGFIQAPDYGFSNPAVISTLAIGALLMTGFIVNEFRSPHAMMPLTLFRVRTFSGANMITFFLYGTLNVLTLFLPLNFVQIQGYRPTYAGLAFMPFAIVLAAMSPLAGRLADCYGSRMPLIIGSALTGVALVLMGNVGLTGGASDYWTTFFPVVLVFGIGMGFTVAPLTTAVMGSVTTGRAGVASGVNNSISRTAGVLMIAVLGSAYLLAYSADLEGRTSSMPLTSGERMSILAEAENLGEASAPDSIDSEIAVRVDEAYDLAFIESFRLLMYISAILAWVGTMAAFIFIEKLPPRPGPAGVQ